MDKFGLEYANAHKTRISAMIICMKIAIIANAVRANTLPKDEVLAKLTCLYALTYDLFVIGPGELKTTLKNINKGSYQAFLIIGGDGTVRTVIETLLDYEIPVAILPRGTFNHFSKELGQPETLEECLKMIKNFKTKKVDVGQINELIFINHSSIGFYSRILKIKEKYKNLLGRSKLLKFLFTTFNFFRAIPIYSLTIQTKNAEINQDTALLFIGNNYHFTSLLKLGARESLTLGYLSIYILNCKNRWQIIRGIFAILFNTASKEKYLNHFMTKHLTVSAQSKMINVDIDGDLFKLETPLNYIIHQKKLTVIIQ